MANLNQCNFIGRVGVDIEQRFTPDGTGVVNLSIAVTEKWKDKNNQPKEATEWVRVTAYRKLSDIIAQYVNKGDLIYISGKLRTRKWQDNNGNDRYTTEIIADQMQMLGGGSGQGQQQPAQQGYQAPQQQAPRQAQQAPQQSPKLSEPSFDDDSIPF